MAQTVTALVSLDELIWESYIKAERTKNVSESTIRNYTIRFPAFQRRLGKPLQEARPIDLQLFFAKLMEQRYMNSTISTYGGILTGYYSWIEKMLGTNEYGQPIHPNPMKAINLPAPDEKELPSLTRTQLKQLKDYFKEHDPIAFDITDLLVRYCLRVGELLPDRLDHKGRNPKKVQKHIRFPPPTTDPETKRKHQTVIFKVKGAGGKKPKRKTKPLPLLDRDGNLDQKVNPTDRTRIRKILNMTMTVGTYRKKLYKAQEALKIRLSDSNGDPVRLRCHILRHSSMTIHGARAFQQTGDEESATVVLSKISGHDNLNQLKTYCHPSQTTLADVMKGV